MTGTSRKGSQTHSDWISTCRLLGYFETLSEGCHVHGERSMYLPGSGSWGPDGKTAPCRSGMFSSY